MEASPLPPYKNPAGTIHQVVVAAPLVIAAVVAAPSAAVFAL